MTGRWTDSLRADDRTDSDEIGTNDSARIIEIQGLMPELGAVLVEAPNRRIACLSVHMAANSETGGIDSILRLSLYCRNEL